MDKNYLEKIKFEITQIDELIDNADFLLKAVKNKDPDFIECSAIALTLQSFYNGLENIFLTIAKSKKIIIKNDNKWHKELLNYIFKNKIIKENLKDTIREYMAFRHFIRHSYGFQIEWDQM